MSERTAYPQDSGGVDVSGTPVLSARDVRRTFGSGATEVHALDGVSLEIPTGRLTVVRGPSGSGKTTLLNLLGGLDRPTSGQVVLDDGRVDEVGVDVPEVALWSGAPSPLNRA